jgi:hypothetical protein
MWYTLSKQKKFKKKFSYYKVHKQKTTSLWSQRILGIKVFHNKIQNHCSNT